jgi:MFS transporter, ACS family, hexuronate transporter
MSDHNSTVDAGTSAGVGAASRETAAPSVVAVVGRFRWMICALLFLGVTKNYMDRQVLSVLKTTLQHDLGWNEIDYSNLVFWFQAMYAVGMLAVGRLIDKLGTRVGYALAMFFWSLASMAHSVASSLSSFLVARAALGFGESGVFPASIKAVSEWFPKKERALSTGIFNAGSNVGAILASLLVPWVTLHWGWRWAFLITGSLGFAWLALWLLVYRKPEEHSRCSPEELAYIRSDAGQPVGKVKWMTLLPLRQTWTFAVAKFLTDPIWWFYLYWLPKFFDSRFHLGLSHLGVPLIIVYNFSAIGSIGGGWLPALFTRLGFDIVKARYTAMLVAACLVLPIFFVGQLTSQWAAIGILGMATAAHQGWSANLYTTVSDMFPREAVGVVVGIGGMAGAIGGVLFSLGVGYVLELTHSYTLLFAISASAYLIAFGVLRLLVPGLPRVNVDAL